MDLSIIIPARNEMFLSKTIEDILSHSETDIEVIAVLDGEWADPPIEDNGRVALVYHSGSVGQRAACNEAARMSTGKYIMKADAHCAFDQGFDRKMLSVIQDNWTMAPLMRNLHAFDWVCPNGHRRYQGPSGPCRECGEPTTMDVVWIAKKSPQSTSYCFDTEPHFQYFGDFRKRAEGQGPISPSMSLQGSCFMVSRDKYFELNLCDEAWGNWGSQGIEVACKTWLSGGQVMINHGTWYAHMFRTQGGDFGFPWPQSGRQVEHAKKTARETFFENKWPKQIHSLSWLVEKFWPVPGWKDEDLLRIKQHDHKVETGIDSRITTPTEKKIETGRCSITHSGIGRGNEFGIVYFTDNRLNPAIMRACQEQLRRSVNGTPIVSVSLQKIDFGENIVLELERGYLAMFEQILAGLEALDTKIVFLAEHDVLYHPSHYNFRPPKDDIYYYNLNCWKVRASDGHALTYITKQTSQLCANRELLLNHYRERVKRTEDKYNLLGDTSEYRNWIRRQGFEPGSHHRDERVDDFLSDVWRSEYPNLDIRHDNNLTSSRWRQDQFRDKRNCQGWQEAERVPGWYEVGKFSELLKGV